MNRLFLLFYTVLLVLTACHPAEISTRQGMSQNDILHAEEFEFVTVPTSVMRGEIASVTVKGAPNRLFAISVHLSSGVSKAKGLEDCKSDVNGFVTWTWKIGSQTKPGEYRITVTCDGKFADTYFTVE